MLRLQELSFGYPKGPQFAGISLELEAGGVTCLAGPNGSGKSSLLKALCGILPLRGGQVHFSGRDLSTLSRRALAEIIAYVPQHSPIAAISVAEAVLIGRTPYMGFLPAKRDRQAVEKALAELNLLDWRQRSLDELSGGERQMVLIARALAQETPILVLDEPTAGLDVRFQLQVYELLRRLAVEQGKLILAAEHDLNLAAAYGQNVVLMEGGQIAACGSPAQVLRADLLSRIYRVQSRVLDLDGQVHVLNSLPPGDSHGPV